MKKKGNKRKKQTDGRFYTSLLKISGNKNLFPWFPQCHNRESNHSFPKRREISRLDLDWVSLLWCSGYHYYKTSFN